MAFSFFPKDEKFYDLMNTMAEEAHEATCAFSALIETGGAGNREHNVHKLYDIRARSKQTSQKLTEELCKSFITPFDREDIQDIANLLYKIPKIMEKAGDRINMHGMSTEGGDFKHQADLIIREAEATKLLINALTSAKNLDKVVENVKLLKELEHQGDKIRNELIVALFKSERDIRDILLRRDIYDMLEKAVDRFRDIAGVALQIVLKHS